jgi:hypothetical protein
MQHDDRGTVANVQIVLAQTIGVVKKVATGASALEIGEVLGVQESASSMALRTRRSAPGG